MRELWDQQLYKERLNIKTTRLHMTMKSNFSLLKDTKVSISSENEVGKNYGRD